MSTAKQLSPAFCSGGGGPNFETRVQASFVALMLTGGHAPCMPCWPIVEIKLQGKGAGYDTDDFILTVQDPTSEETRKLLGQIKHGLRFQASDVRFGDAIQAAWRDFNAAKHFTRGKDQIAFVTEGLGAKELDDVAWILDQARFSPSAEEFIKNVEKIQSVSKSKRDRLKAFKAQLKKANGDEELTSSELQDFLRHLHVLGYDLSKHEGVVLSLLQSHISQFDSGDSSFTWSKIIDEVQYWNQNAGTIKRENLSEALLEKFVAPREWTIPPRLQAKPSATPDLSTHASAPDFGIGLLLGSWNEATAGDTKAAARLARKDYRDWIFSVRQALDLENSPLRLKNGTWSAESNVETWKSLGKSIFDDDLNALGEVAVEVLSEHNPMFDLSIGERYMADIRGKSLTHSKALREGLANTLAIVGSRPDFFPHCSSGKAEGIALMAVRRLLEEADWVLWGSLNSLLPSLAEAAPEEFLSAVENALVSNPCPFKLLFSQEGRGMWGSNYLTGLLWALESLAWDNQYLSRVTVILGELAAIDPGGQWANRPANSLTTLFLPWLPQTLASCEQRKAALKTLVGEVPTSAWDLVISLLPSNHRASSGSHRPKWRTSIPDNHNEQIPRDEYWDQIAFCAELALEIAIAQPERLCELVPSLGSLTSEVDERLLQHFESEAVSSLPDDEKTKLWVALVDFISRHRRHLNAEWSLGEGTLNRIASAASKLAPIDPLLLHRRLFCGSEFDLYEGSGGIEEQGAELNIRRQKAVEDIYQTGGSRAVLQFAETVQHPQQVGIALGHLAEVDDNTLLPSPLLAVGTDATKRFASGFIWARHQEKGWSWADELLAKNWNEDAVCRLLQDLPFCQETWSKVAAFLPDEKAYWKNVQFHPYRADRSWEEAIDKLLDHDRPNAAIGCLFASMQNEKQIDYERSVKALLAAANNAEEESSDDAHYAVELIKALQVNPEATPEDLGKVEWAHLRRLDGYQGARAIFLEQRLASTPSFFSEIIQLVFRSQNEGGEKEDPSEEKIRLASHAHHLLHEWHKPPGTQQDGSFCQEAFTQWVDEVKETCENSGHLKVALSQIGQVLIYAPTDEDGFWIDKSVAGVMNAKDAQSLRDGFRTGKYNSRGMIHVDPTGAPEKQLAEAYSKMAEDADTASYSRLATMMRELQKWYSHDAERVIMEHGEE